MESVTGAFGLISFISIIITVVVTLILTMVLELHRSKATKDSPAHFKSRETGVSWHALFYPLIKPIRKEINGQTAEGLVGCLE